MCIYIYPIPLLGAGCDTGQFLRGVQLVQVLLLDLSKEPSLPHYLPIADRGGRKNWIYTFL